MPRRGLVLTPSGRYAAQLSICEIGRKVCTGGWLIASHLGLAELLSMGRFKVGAALLISSGADCGRGSHHPRIGHLKPEIT